MAHLKSAPQSQGFGFDPTRSLLVLPVQRTHSMYLVAGSSLQIKIDDETCATWTEGKSPDPAKDASLEETWEKKQVIRLLKIKGEKIGATILNAYAPDGRPGIQPLDIRVVDDSDCRQIKDKDSLAPKLLEEIKLASLSFRDALIRVAEDQMYSAIGRSGTGGKGRYDAPEINWCGSFVHWCYAVASSAKGVTNPFGSASRENNSLRSGIKALYAGMKDESKFTVIQYEGPDRYGGLKKIQKLIEIGPQNPVMRGDICLPRKNSGDTFPHVCMVYDPPNGSGTFTTIDGNQTGAYRPGNRYSPYCIDINEHNAKERWEDGKTYAFAFIYVKDI